MVSEKPRHGSVVNYWGRVKTRSTPWRQGPREAAKYHRTLPFPPVLGSLKDTLLKIDKQYHWDLLKILQLLAQHRLFSFGQVKMQWKPVRTLSMTKVSILLPVALTAEMWRPTASGPCFPCSAPRRELSSNTSACPRLHFRDGGGGTSEMLRWGLEN